MRIVTFMGPEGPSVGVVEGDGASAVIADCGPEFHPIERLLASDRLDLLAAAAAGAPRRRLEEVTLLPPVLAPRRILCIGLNYHDHRAETGRGHDTANPTVFTRFPSSLVGHGHPIVQPRASSQLDYEGELAIIIGKPGRAIAPGRAFEHIAGYSCFMDGSVRDFQRHTSQFTPGKNFDRSGSFGPWLVTRDDVPDPASLRLQTRVNGEVFQDATTDLLIFDIPTLVAYCSTFTTLEPGDVIATGTPGGVGSARDPQIWLRPGDIVEIDISDVGVLTNPVVAE